MTPSLSSRRGNLADETHTLHRMDTTVSATSMIASIGTRGDRTTTRFNHQPAHTASALVEAVSERGPAPYCERLVGRDRELAALHELVGGAIGGHGGAKLLEGVPGIGKTRLLAETSAFAISCGMRVLTARAVETEQYYPFALALQLFEQAVASVTGPRAELFRGAAALARPLFCGECIVSTASPAFPLLHGLFWLTANLADVTPTLLCVDDAQFGDDASLTFLQYLIRRVPDLPIAVVVAARPADTGERDSPTVTGVRQAFSSRLALRPLTSEEVTRLIRGRFPDADAEFCQACAEVTDGIPFYLLELLAVVVADQLGVTAADSHRLRLIGQLSVGRASLFRLSRLGPDAVALAAALAVFADSTPLRRAAALANLPFERAAAAADALAGERLIAHGEILSFTNPAIAALIVADQPPLQTALSHKQAARLLAQDNLSPLAVAGQLLAAPAAADPWAVAQLRQAAKLACGSGAADVATRLLIRALEEPPAADDRADLLVELGTAEAIAGVDDAVGHLTEGLGLLTDPRARNRARQQLARALTARGDGRQAAEVLEAALAETAETAQRQPAQALPNRADSHPFDRAQHPDQRPSGQATELLADYLAIAAFEPGLRQHAYARTRSLLVSPPAGDTPAERALLAALAMRSGQLGEPLTKTLHLIDHAWAGGQLLTEQGPEGPGWRMTVSAAELAGDHRRGEAIAAAAVIAAQAAGSVDAFLTASYFSGWTRLALGRTTDARADIEQALAANPLGCRRYVTAGLALKATLAVLQDDFLTARQALAAADGAAGEQPDAMALLWRLTAGGHLAMAQHDYPAALQLFRQAGEGLTQRLDIDYTVLPWRTEAARAALAVGEHQLASDLIDYELALATRSGVPGHLGRALRARGLLRQRADGIELLRQACALFAEAGETLERARTLIDLGGILRRRGDRVQCRDPLNESAAEAVKLGATLLVRWANDELAASGAPRHRNRPSKQTALTPSERRVVELAVDGLTNARIAQALFVTPKTVEFHLRHAYQKLGIARRSELAGALNSELL